MHDPDAPPPPPGSDLGVAPGNNDRAAADDADGADGSTTSARAASNHGRPYEPHRVSDDSPKPWADSPTAWDDIEVPDIETDPAAAAALTRLGTGLLLAMLLASLVAVIWALRN